LSQDFSIESAIKTILKNRCMSARLASVPLEIVYDYDAIANGISHEEIAGRDKDLGATARCCRSMENLRFGRTRDKRHGSDKPGKAHYDCELDRY
jgi:hypothetical protein